MIITLVLGLLFMLGGAITFKFPPKEINYIYGYRTASSMKSQERWDFAQKYSSKRIFIVGVCLLIISLLLKFFEFNITTEFIVQAILLILSILLIIVDTEKAIKRKFKK